MTLVSRAGAALVVLLLASGCVSKRPSLAEARAAAAAAYEGGPSTEASRAAAAEIRTAGRAVADSRESPAALAELEDLIFDHRVWLPAQVELDVSERIRLAGGVAPYLTEDDPAVRETALTVMARLVPGDGRAPVEAAPAVANYMGRLLNRQALGAYEARHRLELLATSLRLIDPQTRDHGVHAAVARLGQDEELQRVASERRAPGWSGALWATTEAARLQAAWRPLGVPAPSGVGMP